MPIDNINDPWRNEEEEPEIQAAPPPVQQQQTEEGSNLGGLPEVSREEQSRVYLDALARSQGAERFEQEQKPEPEPTQNEPSPNDIVEVAGQPQQETQEPPPDPYAPTWEQKHDIRHVDYGMGMDDERRARDKLVDQIKAQVRFARDHGQDVTNEEWGDNEQIDAVLNGYGVRENFSPEATDMLNRFAEHVGVKYQAAKDEMGRLEGVLNTAKNTLDPNAIVEGWEESAKTIGWMAGGISDEDFTDYLLDKMDKDELARMRDPGKVEGFKDVHNGLDALALVGNVFAEQSSIIAESMLVAGASAATAGGAGAAWASARAAAKEATEAAIKAEMKKMAKKVASQEAKRLAEREAMTQLGRASVKAGGSFIVRTEGFFAAGGQTARTAAEKAIANKAGEGVAKSMARREGAQAAKGAAEAAAREAARKKSASNLGAMVVDYQFNLASSAEQRMGEAQRRGSTEIGREAVFGQAAGRTVADYFGPIRKLATGGFRPGTTLQQMARDGVLTSARTFRGGLVSAGGRFAREGLGAGTSFVGETVSDRITNYAVNNTLLINDETDWTDAVANDIETFVKGGIMSLTGAPGLAKRAMAEVQLNRAVDAFADTKGAAFDNAFAKSRRMRDTFASPGFAKLDLASQRSILEMNRLRAKLDQANMLQRSARNEQEANAAASEATILSQQISQMRDTLSPDGAKWIDAYNSCFSKQNTSMAEFDNDVNNNSETAAKLAGKFAPDAPQVGVISDAISEMCGGEVSYENIYDTITDNKDGILIDSGNVCLRIDEEESANGERTGKLVISITRTDGGPMADNFISEFRVEDFALDGEGMDHPNTIHRALEAAVGAERKLSSWAKWADAKEYGPSLDFANRIAEKSGRKVIIVRNSQDLQNAGLPIDDNGKLRGKEQVFDSNYPNGLSHNWLGFTEPDGTIYVRADAYNSAAELAAIVDHESFHSRLVEMVAKMQEGEEGKKLAADFEKTNGQPLTPENLRRVILAQILGVELTADDLAGLDSTEIDKQLENKEEKYAWDAMGMVPREQRVTLLQKIFKNVPILKRCLSTYMFEDLGKAPENQEEMANYLFAIMAKTENKNGTAFLGVQPLEAKAKEMQAREKQEQKQQTDRNEGDGGESAVPAETGPEGGEGGEGAAPERTLTTQDAGPSVRATEQTYRALGELLTQAVKDGAFKSKNKALVEQVKAFLQGAGVAIEEAKVEDGTYSIKVDQGAAVNAIMNNLAWRSDDGGNGAVNAILAFADSIGVDVLMDEDGNITGVVDQNTTTAEAEETKEPAPEQEQAPTPEPTPAPEPTPEPAPAPEPKPEPVKEPEPAPAAEPKPEPKPEPPKKTLKNPNNAQKAEAKANKERVAAAADAIQKQLDAREKINKKAQETTSSPYGPRAKNPTPIERGEMPQPRGEGSPLARGPEPTPQNARVPRAPLSPVSRTDLGETRVAEWLVAEKKTAANKTKTRTDANGKKTLKKPEAVAPTPAPAPAQAEKPANVPQPVESAKVEKKKTLRRRSVAAAKQEVARAEAKRDLRGESKAGVATAFQQRNAARAARDRALEGKVTVRGVKDANGENVRSDAKQGTVSERAEEIAQQSIRIAGLKKATGTDAIINAARNAIINAEYSSAGPNDKIGAIARIAYETRQRDAAAADALVNNGLSRKPDVNNPITPEEAVAAKPDTIDDLILQSLSPDGPFDTLQEALRIMDSDAAAEAHGPAAVDAVLRAIEPLLDLPVEEVPLAIAERAAALQDRMDRLVLGKSAGSSENQLAKVRAVRDALAAQHPVKDFASKLIGNEGALQALNDELDRRNERSLATDENIENRSGSIVDAEGHDWGTIDTDTYNDFSSQDEKDEYGTGGSFASEESLRKAEKTGLSSRNMVQSRQRRTTTNGIQRPEEGTTQEIASGAKALAGRDAGAAADTATRAVRNSGRLGLAARIAARISAAVGSDGRTGGVDGAVQAGYAESQAARGELGRRLERLVRQEAVINRCWAAQGIEATLRRLPRLEETELFGSETSTIFKDKAANQVFKVTRASYADPTAFWYRMALFNSAFGPDTGVGVLGYGLNELGEFSIIGLQQYVEKDDAATAKLTPQRIFTYLKTVFGPNLRKTGDYAFETPLVTIRDAGPGNVVVDKHGRIRVIDIDIDPKPALKDAMTERFGSEQARFASIGSLAASRLGIGGLSDAERMEREGADRTAIWRQTGWWRGKDGKWRVEVPDISEAAANEIYDRVKSGDLVRLGEIEDESIKLLTKAYPWIAEVAVRRYADGRDVSMTASVGFRKRKDGSFLASIGLNLDNTNTSRRNTLAHEIQHVIQVAEGGSIRGTATSGSVSYWRNPREIEARVTADRASMSEEERLAEPPWITYKKESSVDLAMYVSDIADCIRRLRSYDRPGRSEQIAERERNNLSRLVRAMKKQGTLQDVQEAFRTYGWMFSTEDLAKYLAPLSVLPDSAVESLKSEGYEVAKNGTINDSNGGDAENSPESNSPSGVQKSADVNYPDAGAEIASARFASIGSLAASRLGIGGLSDAERMEREGADRTAIWRQTGWWRGRDGKWRVEVDDSDLVAFAKSVDWSTDSGSENFLPKTLLDKLAELKWADVMEEPRTVSLTFREIADAIESTGNSFEVFQAYPDSANVEVSITIDPNQRASGSTDGDSAINIVAPNMDRAIEVLAHERQHIIQDIAGMAVGTSSIYNTEDGYLNSAGEVEARNTARRLRMTPEERAATPPWETQDVADEKQTVRFFASDESLRAAEREAMFLDGKHVFHATGIENVEGIVKHGLRRGSNVSYDENGQAFDAEGGPILVFNLDGSDVQHKGYQYDGITNAPNVRPVAILRNTSSLLPSVEDAKRKVEETSAALADAIDNVLKPELDRLGITEDEFYESRYDLRYKYRDDARFVAAYENVEDAFSAESAAVDTLIRAEKRADSGKPQIDLSKFGLPVIDIRYEFDEQKQTNIPHVVGFDASKAANTSASSPSGVQKSADVNYPDAGAEISAARFASIGSQRKAEMARLLGKHRPDLNADEVVAELEKFGTVKEQKAALHWVIRGGLALPQDAYKVADALSVAEKAKVDPFRYKSPDELLLANKDFKPSARPIDPATVPELSDARDEGDGIVSYLVQDDRQGQAAMRRIIDTHWGEDANPWCLLARGEGEGLQTEEFGLWLTKNIDRVIKRFGSAWWATPNGAYQLYKVETGRDALEQDNMKSAWHWWLNYSALPKRVAFQNGRLLAFMATERGNGASNVEFSKPENERRVESFYKEYSKIPKDERPGNFQQWMMEEHPEEYDAIAEDEQDGGDSINTYQFSRPAEEWWDRQDESHPDLDWAKEDVGRSMFASEDTARMAAELEEKYPLMAVHGLSLGSLRKALDEGAFVMPSIAVRNHGDTWRQAGYIDEELSDRIPANQQVFVLFPKRTIADENTDMFYGDAYTPTINSLQGDYSQENIDRTREEFEPDITQPASRFNIGYLDDARLALREKNAELVAARDDATNSYIALIRELERAGVSEQRVHGEWMNIKAAYNTDDELTRSDIADELRVRRVIPEQYVERLADALDKMIGAQYALDHDLSGATLVEAKAWRRVPFSEAAAVLIDNSAPKDVERILKYNGVENVVRINMADPNALADAQSTFAPRFASDDSLRAAEGGLTGSALSDPNIVALALGAVRVHNPDGSVSYSTNVTDLIRAEQFLNEDPKFAPWTGRQNLRAVFAEAGNVLRKDPAAAERIKEKVLDAYKKYQAGDKNAAARLSVSAHDVQVLRAMLVTRNQALVAANDAVADAENNGADNLNDLRVAELNAEAQYYDALMACGFAERAIGTALGSIARLMENDFSMGGLIKKLGDVDGGVTAEEAKKLRGVSREGEAAQKKHDDAVKAIEEEERKKLVARKVDDAVGEGRRNKAAGRKEKTVAEAVEAARKELADGEMVDISVYPELWAQIGDAVKGIARAIIGEHLEGPSRLKALDHAAFAKRLLAETNKAFEGRITSRDENHKELTERDVLNLFSDYGDPEKLQPGYDASRNVSTEQMREAQSRLKKLSQMMSALEDIKAGKAPLEAYGHLRDLTPKQVDEEMERVKKEMDEAWRASGLDKNLLHRAMSPLELVREGIEKRIAEIKANLAAGELAKKQGRKPIAGEEGLADLREELKRLQSIQDSVFKNRGLTDEQRLAAIEENYRRTEASAMATLQRLMAGGRPVKPLDMSDDGARSAWATAERAWRQKIGEARRAAADATRRLNELRQRMTPESYRGEKALERAIARREDMTARWEEAVNAGRVTLGGRGIMRDPKMRFDPRLVEADRAYREVIAKRDNLIAEIKLNHAKGLTKAAMYLSVIPNTMRQMMASGDNSGIGVQCAVATVANPIDGIKAIFPGIKVFWNTLFGNGMATERYMESIYSDPDFERIAAYVEIPRTDGKGNFTQNSTEEFFQHGVVAERLQKKLGIPIFDNRYMRASEAGFNVPVAMIRFELAKRLLAHLRDMKGEGYTPTNEEMSLLGKVVNAATGRGKFFSGGGPVNLSNVFWASGRVSGQVESLFLPARLFLKHGEVDLAFRKKIARELIWKPWRNFAAAALLFGLAHAIFKDEDDDDPFMELDPTSSKFLRMKVGTRYFDITSGMPSYITLAAKGIWGEKKTVGGKRVAMRGQGAFGQSWSNELWRFFRNKLRPEYGNIISLFDGRNAIGEEIEPTVLGVSKFLTVNGFLPLTAMDIVDSIEDFDRNGPLFTASLAFLANIGYTTSNFGQTPYKNDRAAIETIDEVRKQAEAGVEGMDDAWSDIALNENNARYIKAASDKQMADLAKRIADLNGLIRNGETTKDRKSGRVVSRRKLTREERRAAEREKDALEAEYHERLWPELKRIR